MVELADALQTIDYEAEYAMESPVECPKCQHEISALHVVRLLRNKVNFTSTLPRKGYVMLCPRCRGIVSATLGSLSPSPGLPVGVDLIHREGAPEELDLVQVPGPVLLPWAARVGLMPADLEAGRAVKAEQARGRRRRRMWTKLLSSQDEAWRCRSTACPLPCQAVRLRGPASGPPDDLTDAV